MSDHHAATLAVEALAVRVVVDLLNFPRVSPRLAEKSSEECECGDLSVGWNCITVLTGNLCRLTTEHSSYRPNKSLIYTLRLRVSFNNSNLYDEARFYLI